MPITFIGSIKSFHSDEEGESVIAFRVPLSHKKPITKISDLTKQILSVTVCSETELARRVKTTKSHP